MYNVIYLTGSLFSISLVFSQIPLKQLILLHPRSNQGSSFTFSCHVCVVFFDLRECPLFVFGFMTFTFVKKPQVVVLGEASQPGLASLFLLD